MPLKYRPIAVAVCSVIAALLIALTPLSKLPLGGFLAAFAVLVLIFYAIVDYLVESIMDRSEL